MSINDRGNQPPIYNQLAEFARTLGSSHRLVLLEQIAQGERPVEMLATLSGLSIANTSQHLQLLKHAGFVETRRDGKHVLYRLGKGPILELITALQAYSEFQQQQMRTLVEDNFKRRDLLEGITSDQLAKRIKQGDVVLLDVRPNNEYALGHIPGAINITVEELGSKLCGFDSDTEIVAYCRGPYCVLSVNAVLELKASGFTAYRLEDGFYAWKDAGMAVVNDSSN